MSPSDLETNEVVRPIGVDIIQPIVDRYRISLYEKLARMPGLDIAIQASPFLPGVGQSYKMDGVEQDTDRRAYRILGSSLIWQRGLRLIKARKAGDVLVVCGDWHHVSTLLLVVRARLKGVRVIWWGHGWHPGTSLRKARFRVNFIKRFFDAALLYDDHEIPYFLEWGFPGTRVFALNNTIDLAPVFAQTAHWSKEKLADFRLQQGFGRRRVLLFCSVLRPKTALDVLLKAMASPLLRGSEMELVVIGDGPMMSAYQGLAKRLGIHQRVRWLGAIYREEELAPWFLISDLFVYPGSIGLSLMHAFGYGLPVVTHDNARHQMPEYAALRPDVNGVVFRERDGDSLANVLLKMLGADAKRQEMSLAALDTVKTVYTIENMVSRFAQAIRICSGMDEKG